MIEHMPGEQTYTDRGPRKETGIDRYPRDAGSTIASPCVVTAADGTKTVLPERHSSEVQEIIRRGRQEPRRLTLEEARTADKNRAAQQKLPSGTSSFKPSGEQRHPPGTQAYGHSPRRTSW
jgi:hypothetical protein